MSRYTITVWRCDLCHLEERNHLGPTGWTWYRSAMNGHVAHRCAACTAKTAPEHQGLPLGVETATQYFARK